MCAVAAREAVKGATGSKFEQADSAPRLRTDCSSRLAPIAFLCHRRAEHAAVAIAGSASGSCTLVLVRAEMSGPGSVDETAGTEAALPPALYTASHPSPASRLTFPFPTVPSVPLPTAPHAWLPAFRGVVLQGTCGWTDSSILKGNHFYPPHVHTAVDRLRHYSAFFPNVECDSSNYAIPPPSRVQSWCDATPAGFLFHFKAFGLFTSLSVRPDALPGPLRSEQPASVTDSTAPVRLDSLPASYVDSLWRYWNTAVLPAHTAGKLGLVIFQFQLSFAPSDANRQHVEWCRRHLCAAYRMGVEFRDRRWTAGEERERTFRWMAALDVTYIVCDDLEQETYRPGREVLGLGEDSQLPVVHATTASHSLYVRLHRRTGDNRGDRVLAAHEFTDWAARLKAEQGVADAGQQRPVFFLWGTDCIDDPVTNARRLSEALKQSAASLWLDWKALRAKASRQQGGGNLLALFSKQEKRNRDRAQEQEAATAEATAGGSGSGSGSGGSNEQAADASEPEHTVAGGVGVDKKEDAALRKKRRIDSEGKSGERSDT